MKFLERARLRREIVASYQAKLAEGMTHEGAHDAVLDEAKTKYGANIDWAKIIELILTILELFKK